MGGVPRTRDDGHVGPQLPHDADDLVDGPLRMDGDDHRCRAHQAATLEKSRIGGVAVVDISAAAAVGADGGRVVVGGDEGLPVPLEQVADDLSDPAMPDYDGMPALALRWCGGQ